MSPLDSSNLAVLPEFLRPKSGVPLVRLGRDGDGGYLIDQRNLDEVDLLISMGINDDWSFEQEFLKHRDVQYFGYDASISRYGFTLDCWKRATLIEPLNTISAIRTLLRYHSFFNETTRIHRSEYVGFDLSDNQISLGTLVDRDCGDAQNIFFKIDIEGSEYRLLDDLITCASRIRGLAIEFHDVDLHLDRIQGFVEAFPLAICHVHGNNYVPVPPSGVPQVIELSFTSAPVGRSLESAALPHDLDRPSNPRCPEIMLNFES